MKEKTLTVYFAGDLFDGKDISGNLMLASAIEKNSAGRYKIQLPQNGECEVANRTSQTIRDADFEMLLSCDAIIANFDGPDLDSGTVVEFCFAKMVDMPAVLLRTDFRDSGDHTLPDGCPWNLMCSHYPRTEVRHINSMVLYHECKQSTKTPAALLENYYQKIARTVIEALDQAVAADSWLKTDELSNQYAMAVKSIGGGISQLLTPEKLQDIVQQKAASGIYLK
ncbi:MAG: hypothetical protein E7053_01735 [Lentisphaerae bacterium]|nr:hypothetical protein [Lentisphaerota bacterium]